MSIKAINDVDKKGVVLHLDVIAFRKEEFNKLTTLISEFVQALFLYSCINFHE